LAPLILAIDIKVFKGAFLNETKAMVNKKFLDQMKKGYYLINLSRRPIIENKEIIHKKLLSNQIVGYGTVVWTNELPVKMTN